MHCVDYVVLAYVVVVMILARCVFPRQ